MALHYTLARYNECIRLIMICRLAVPKIHVAGFREVSMSLASNQLRNNFSNVHIALAGRLSRLK